MTSPINYRPDIDGLRAVAVLAVVAHHFWPELLTGGYVGVDVFFVISGFLITKIIHKEIFESRFSFVDFYDRRIRRIFPALFAMLGATLIAGWFLMLPSDYLATFKASIGALFFSANVVFWRQMAAGYFAATDASINPLLHTWSLGVEEQFYIVFPILLLLLARYWPRWQTGFLLAAALVSVGLAQYLLSAKPVAVFFLTPFRAWELLIGALLALGAVPDIRNSVMREAVAGLGLLAILIAAVAFDPRSPFPGLYALLPVLGTAAVIHAGSSGRAMVTGLITLQPVVYIGLISYSLYLWHWPVLVLGKYAIAFREDEVSKIVLLALSFVISIASYHFIEKPFRAKKVLRSRVFGYAFAGSVALLTVSILGWRSAGFTQRVDSQTLRYDAARSPEIPFLACDGALAPCPMGLANTAPTSLFWGDSHMLAWAPGVDYILRNSGKSGVLAVRSMCPPLFGVTFKESPGCRQHNEELLELLKARPEMRVVVLSAFWFSYTHSDPRHGAGNQLEGELFSHSLRNTIRILQENGKTVVAIGPVPVYEVSVPLGLALERFRGSPQGHQDLQDYLKQNKFFQEAVASQPDLILASPGAWLCRPTCAQEIDGTPLYRDPDHLSEFGATTLAADLAGSLTTAFDAAGLDTEARRTVALAPSDRETK